MEPRISLVTGASSGIGRAVAAALIERGDSVILAARRKELLDELIAQTGDLPGKAISISTDVSDPAAVTHLFEKIQSKFKRLDLLFNNAGVSLPSTELEDFTYGDWRKVIDINVTGSFLCAQAAFRMMKSQRPMGGRIINNGSLSAQTPRALSAAYTISKHAITGLTKSAALDGRKYRIACGQIDIGNADSQMAAKMTKGVVQADGQLAIEPIMPVDHVKDAVMYMANLPLDSNVLFMSVMATQMPFVGRG